MTQIINVGIRISQQELIKRKLKYGESINKFVQDAVDDKLYSIKETSKMKTNKAVVV